ncbi:MAG: DUF3822 family protein [Flavobacteriales bacterium]|nr:DUF3822 family protein [Flavobacteriales bacterium]MCB9166153.1 DUF3822 family protein [Flavobacteriales bacterium]
MEATYRSVDYDRGRERTYHLSILVTPTGTGWCVHEQARSRCVALASTKGQVLPQLDLLPSHPMSISFVAAPELSTLVPESALAMGAEKDHLALVHGPLPTGLLRDEPVDLLGARCVYLHDEAAERIVLDRYPGARPIALRTLMVHGVLERSRNGTTLLLHRSGKRLDIALGRNGKLLLSNAFHATNGTDMLYYVLFVLERSQLPLADVTVLAGGTDLTADDMQLMRGYLPRAYPTFEPGEPTIAGLDIEAPERWSALLDQAACAS